uniref:peptidoglycan DD-metalloendopeptidase family protein n=1 Tax=Geminocystis herdmanii TaxID=669359 RepID=UPI00034DA2A3|nr:M23 family metallopeptidase [Geminocystis herdmanii]
MNLKLVLPKLPQTAIVLGLGLVLIPNVAKATNPVNATENLELSRPTLLVTKAEEVSALVENAQTVPSHASISVVENVDRNNYSIAKNQRLTSLFEEAKDNPPLANVKSLTTKKVDSPTLVAQNFTNPPSQSASLPIAVELPSQPANNQYISIPIQVETQPATTVNNSIPVNQSIPIPVVIPSSEVTTQQTETQISIEKVEQPTLISNNPREFKVNSQPLNNRIINPSESPRNNLNPSEDLVSVIPIEVEYYNPMVTPSAGQMVSPDLPEINSPDPFLPEGDRPFTGYIWPAKGVFTSGYGPRWGRMHRGIDIAAPVGTPIVAAAEGEVVSAGWNSGGFGNLVKIRHFDGTVTLYAHNSKIHVRRGQFVKQGQHIANMGSTGFSTGPHLHFEIHPQGQKPINPIALLPKNRN